MGHPDMGGFGGRPCVLGADMLLLPLSNTGQSDERRLLK